MPQRLSLKDSGAESRLLRIRLLIAGFIIIVLTGVLIARYSFLQITQYEQYRTASDHNRIHLQPIAPRRGLITDRNGVVLAENIPSYTLMLTPERSADLEQTFTQLEHLVGLSPVEWQRFQQRRYRYRPYQSIPLRFKLTEKEIAIIAANRVNLPGVSVEAELIRHYPFGELFVHSLGYMGRINQKDQQNVDSENYSATHHIGKLGIERQYETELHGTIGYHQVESNAGGQILRQLNRIDPIPGKDIDLYLDLELQKLGQDLLAGERGAIVALDPKTGGILAFVSTPAYDPNLFIRGISQKDYQALLHSHDIPLFNRALRGQYPPGSTIKPMFGFMGLQSKVITEKTTVADPGWFKLPGGTHLYRDWKKGGHKARIDLRDSITESCDVFFYELAYRLGVDRLAYYGEQFGFGRKTGIDLLGEQVGIMPSKEWKKADGRGSWFHGDTINLGIGQGYMLATPLQLAVATMAVANHGTIYKPQLAHTIGGVEQPVEIFSQIESDSQAYWDTVIDGMEGVMQYPLGTARVAGSGLTYRMAGKTGTAQVVSIAQGADYNAEELHKLQLDHGLFVGFAPIEDPQIVIALVMENGEHGSLMGRLARQMTDNWLLRQPKQEDATDKKVEGDTLVKSEIGVEKKP